MKPNVTPEQHLVIRAKSLIEDLAEADEEDLDVLRVRAQALAIDLDDAEATNRLLEALAPTNSQKHAAPAPAPPAEEKPADG